MEVKMKKNILKLLFKFLSSKIKPEITINDKGYVFCPRCNYPFHITEPIIEPVEKQCEFCNKKFTVVKKELKSK